MYLPLWLFSLCIPLAMCEQIVLSDESWDLDVAPGINSTENLIFATVGSLMQHWPNTRYRNGHNLVPGWISPGTLLYHGRTDNHIPDHPEWTATDPEHSYLFCQGEDEGGCWFLTLVTVRPLRVLYFDGTSAGKMLGGAMDSQDIIAWGRVIPELVMKGEYLRITDLCSWGKKFGVDGFVRMEMDFEVMLCSFSDGVEVESFLNIAGYRLSPLPGEHPDGDPNDARAEEEMLTGSWYNQFPGDTRVRLDYSRLVSFYDVNLAPSLISQRFGKDRLHHRLDEISLVDVKKVKSAIEENLHASPGDSGTDWQTLFQIIINRFAGRLEDLQYHLNRTRIPNENITDIAFRSYEILTVLLQPYTLVSLQPSEGYRWASPVYELCSTAHTNFVRKNPMLTASERVLLRAVQITTREVCRVVVKLWAQGVSDPLAADLSEWSSSVDDLMAWLDWSVWLKCRPECPFESICYLPTWPYFGGRGPRGQPGGSIIDEESDRNNPMPRCVPRVLTK